MATQTLDAKEALLHVFLPLLSETMVKMVVTTE